MNKHLVLAIYNITGRAPALQAAIPLYSPPHRAEPALLASTADASLPVTTSEDLVVSRITIGRLHTAPVVLHLAKRPLLLLRSELIVRPQPGLRWGGGGRKVWTSKGYRRQREVEGMCDDQGGREPLREMQLKKKVMRCVNVCMCDYCLKWIR